MTPLLKLQFFGVPQIHRDDTPVQDFVTRKALALFIYVATDRRVHLRDKLAALFWRDVAEKQAQNSLRSVLPNLRQLLGSHLQINRRSVAFDAQQPFWSDVDALRAALATGSSPSIKTQGAAHGIDPVALANALAFYQQDFLEGFYVEDAPAFEEWLFLQREELRDLALRGFTYLAEYYVAHNEIAAGLTTTQRLLAIEPWSETAHYQRMLLLARSGRRTEALAQYEACCAMLAEEFGVQPSPAVTAFYEQIKSQPAELHIIEAVSPLAPIGETVVAAPLLAAPPAQQERDEGSLPGKALPPPPPQIYWGEMPRSSFFTGRQSELRQLQRWLFEECCCLITILGVGGAGKTALAATLVRSLAAMTTPGNQEATGLPLTAPHTLVQPFRRILWRSLLNAPPLDTVLRLWLQELSNYQLTVLPTSVDEGVSLLFQYLRSERCLLVLDNLESILDTGDAGGQYRSDYEAYGLLIQRMGETEHQSCLLLTTRELPLGVARLERSYPVVRTLRLDGLPTAAGVELLHAAGLQAEIDSMQSLVQRYSGNPLALQLVAETVADYYQGDVTNFLTHETLIFDDVRIVLDQQLGRLSPLEEEIIFWLAIEREPISLESLAQNLVQPPSHRALLEAIRSLHRRSLVERDTLETPGSSDSEAAFSLQNVVLEYSTERLRDLIYTELVSEKFDYCLRHALIKAQAIDYVRNVQIRLILQPIAQRLLETYGQGGVVDKLEHLVDKLRTQSAAQGGYAAANLLHLAFALEVKPEGWDFSQLPIWQADLRRGHLPATNFSGARFAHCTFLEKFNAILAVAVSPDGELFAAAGTNSNVHLWRASDGELLSICRGQGRWVWAVAFSPDGEILASGGSDGVVHLWEVAGLKQDELEADEEYPWHHPLAGHTDTIFGLAFRPDGQWVASASADCAVRLWDVVHKQPLQTFTGHTATVYAVAFSPDGHFLVSASRDHTVRLWQAATGACLQVLEGYGAQVVTCCFSADGQWLITGDIDGMVQVWQVTREHPMRLYAHFHHTLTNDGVEHVALAISPNGETIATNGPDATIRLRSRTDGAIRKTFQGHTEAVQALAFHPNGKTLISGGWDQALRSWDVATGYRLHTRQGYTNAIHGLALSPDGQTLVSGNADGTLCRWQWATSGLGSVQAGHRGTVQTVAFHPNGQRLASGGSDRTIRLWQVDVDDGQLTERKTFSGHRDGILHIVFSPSGHLLASSSVDQTVRLWDSETGDCRQVLRGSQRVIQPISFSPDGKYLVGGSDDGQVYRWPLLNECEHAQDRLRTSDSSLPFATIPGGCSCLAFSPDGSLLAGAGPDHLIFLWRVCDGERLQVIETPVNSTVYALAFGPPRAAHTLQLASSSGTGAICFWTLDLAGDLPHLNYHLNYMRRDHRGSVRSIHFTPDGETLISGGADETVRLWAVETGHCWAEWPLQQPYAGMKIANAAGLTAAQRAACKALGAVE